MRFLSFILYCLIGFSLTLKVFSQNEQASDAASSFSNLDVKIPPAIRLSQNLWLASVNQFVLVPLAGKIAVYYTGIFNTEKNLQNNGGNNNTYQNFILPFPKGTNANSFVKVKLEEGIQQIQDSILIDAPFGSFHWDSGQIKTLPGVTLIVLKNSYAKISMKSANFIHDTSQNSPDEQYVRVNWDKNSPYPQFYLSHLIPSQLFTYIIIGIFTSLIFSALVIFVKIKKSRS